jgi:acyl-CoA thioesterase-1
MTLKLPPIKTRVSSRKPLAIVLAVAAVAVLLAWFLWPSPYARVKNVASQGKTIVAFGDSLTAGFGAGKGDDYPTKLAIGTDMEILNAGISGDTTEAALARIDTDVLAKKPRIVIVGLGGNDFLRAVPITTTEANLRAIVRRIQGAGSAVMLLGFEFPSVTASYGKMYERVAREEGCLFVPDMLDGILTNPSVKSDEIHPNATGYEMMAERVARPLRKLLAEADKVR